MVWLLCPLLIAICYASVLFGFSNSGVKGDAFSRQYTAKTGAGIVIWLVLFYTCNLLFPKSEFGMGSAQFLTLPVFGVLVYTGLIVADSLYQILCLIVYTLSKLIGGRLNIIFNRRVRISLTVIIMISSLFLPIPIIHVLLVIWGLLICIAGRSKSSNKVWTLFNQGCRSASDILSAVADICDIV